MSRKKQQRTTKEKNNKGHPVFLSKHYRTVRFWKIPATIVGVFSLTNLQAIDFEGSDFFLPFGSSSLPDNATQWRAMIRCLGIAIAAGFLSLYFSASRSRAD